MRQLTGLNYMMTACGCVLIALQASTGWAAPPDAEPAHRQPAQATPPYYGTQPGPQPNYSYRQYRFPGYPYPGRYPYPGYGHPGYGQPVYPRPVYGSTAPAAPQQGTGEITRQATDLEPVETGIQAADTGSSGAATAEPDTPSSPVTETAATAPATALDTTTGPESPMEKARVMVEAPPATDAPAATNAVPAPAASLEPAAAPASETATPGDPAQWMPTYLAAPAAPAAPAATHTTAPTTPVDPSASLPAPAAGPAEAENLPDKAGEQVEGMQKADGTAVPVTK